MRHSSILALMGLFGLLAGSLALGRYLLSFEDNLSLLALAGLPPLLDAQLVSLYLLLRRYRVAVRLRPGGGRYAPAFALASSLALLATALVCLALPVIFLGLVELSWGELGCYLSLVTLSEEHARLAASGSLCAVVSGPPLLLAAVASLALGRFQLVVTPRVPPCDATASSA